MCAKHRSEVHPVKKTGMLASARPNASNISLKGASWRTLSAAHSDAAPWQ